MAAMTLPQGDLSRQFASAESLSLPAELGRLRRELQRLQQSRLPPVLSGAHSSALVGSAPVDAPDQSGGTQSGAICSGEPGPYRDEVCSKDNAERMAADVVRLPLEMVSAGVVSTGIKEFDKLLPGGGWRRGSVIEWLSDGTGCGAELMAMLTLREFLRDRSESLRGRAGLMIVDRQGDIYPPGWKRLGIDLQQMLLVRPQNLRDAAWVCEQGLRCPAVGVVLGAFTRLDERTLRRWQLASEQGGGLGVLLRPTAAAKEPCWADVRLHVCPEEMSAKRRPELIKTVIESQFGRHDNGSRDNGSRNEWSNQDGWANREERYRGENSQSGARMRMPVLDEPWRLRVTVVRGRGVIAGQSVVCEVDHAANTVRVVAPMADSALVCREQQA